ncbi:MAG: glucosyltransferase domain-containing protein [Mycoplasmatales bacterium]
MKNKIDNYLKKSENLAYLVGTFIIFMMSYGLVFNKYIINHDSLGRIQGYIGGIELGRFVRPILNNVFSFATYNPINNSILTYIMLLISCLFIIKLFKITSLFSKLMLSTLIFSYPLFGFFWMYGNDMWMYTFAFLMAILTIYFLTKQGLVNKFMTIFCLVMTLGTYQAMLSVITSLFLVYYIIELAKGQSYTYYELFKQLLLLIFGAIIYYGLVKLSLVITDKTLQTYMNASSIGIFSIVKFIPKALILAYGGFLVFLIGKMEFFGNRYTSVILHLSFVLSYVFLVVKMNKNKISEKNISMVVILLISLPIMIYAQVFATQVFTTYNQFGLLIFILGAFIISLELLEKKQTVYLIIMIIYLFLNINLLNEMLFTETTNSQQIITVVQTLVHDISATPNYQKGDSVTFCGNLQENDNLAYVIHQVPFIFFDYHLRSGNSNYVINGDNYKKIKILINTLGYKFNIQKEPCTLAKNAPAYPEDGYITEENNKFYVKLGN